MKSPENMIQYELKLLDAALRSERGRRRLIQYLTPIVTRLAKTAVVNNEKRLGIKFAKSEAENALKAGWTHLHLALNKYLQRFRGESMGSEGQLYSFSEYFAWYVRQGVREYLARYRSGAEKGDR